jgi:hypothetical protein
MDLLQLVVVAEQAVKVPEVLVVLMVVAGVEVHVLDTMHCLLQVEVVQVVREIAEVLVQILEVLMDMVLVLEGAVLLELVVVRQVELLATVVQEHKIV